MNMALLEVRDLSVGFETDGGLVRAVDELSFSLEPGTILAIVGESGSGKSAAVMTLLGLTRSPNARIDGTARLGELDLIAATSAQLRAVRGAQVAMIFQDPMTALNPGYRVGTQIAEQIRAHQHVSRRTAKTKAVDVLRRAGVPLAAERARAFPHELSGGLRQRVMIAMALCCDPQLIIADEPTTALDVTIQAQILLELRRLRDETGVAIILVTHDLGVVAEIADHVLVMYAGQAVEQASADDLFDNPLHPYTWGLLGSVPRSDRPRRGLLPAIPGTLPKPTEIPVGCRFRPRCPFARAECGEELSLSARTGEVNHLDRCLISAKEKAVLRIVDGGVGLRSTSSDTVEDAAPGAVQR
jgi:peptide/nickel transport system ATP-binding protein